MASSPRWDSELGPVDHAHSTRHSAASHYPDRKKHFTRIMSDPLTEPISSNSPDQEEPEGLDQQPLNLGTFPIDSLMIRTETRSVFEVCRRIDSNQYVMDPDFQRQFVWDVDRQSKLVESALLRIPLPVFYLAETPDGKVVVVDGLQRLTTFHRYLKGQFGLRGLAFAKELNGLKFNDLEAALKNRLEDTPLTLYLIDSKVPDEAKYEIFERVNGGVPLTRQQMRNCLYVGNATRWLGRMADHSDFLDATDRSLNWRTMRDRECINRFAGFHLRGPSHYSGDMEDFLNLTLKGMNSAGDFDQLSKDFLKSMRINHKIFGKHAFRKSIGYGQIRSVINVALFDIFSTEFAAWPEDVAIRKAEEIQNATKQMLQDDTFNEAISRSTNSTRNVKLRFQHVANLIRPLIS